MHSFYTTTTVGSMFPSCLTISQVSHPEQNYSSTASEILAAETATFSKSHLLPQRYGHSTGVCFRWFNSKRGSVEMLAGMTAPESREGSKLGRFPPAPAMAQTRDWS